MKNSSSDPPSMNGNNIVSGMTASEVGPERISSGREQTESNGNERERAPARHASAPADADGETRDASDPLDSDKSDPLDQFTIMRREDGSPWELGRGPLGTTYKAFDPKLQAIVALKIINLQPPTLSSGLSDEAVADADPSCIALAEEDLSSVALTKEEAQAAAGLRHPNVATLFSYGETDSRFFYATEYVNGETVEKRVQREGPLHPMLALRVVRQVTRALVAADHERLVHGNIKPSKLMLAVGKGEDQLVVKVLDFGQTINSGTALREPRPTNPVPTEPPPRFVSPEQLEGQEPDIRSDIYSLGATLWFMLSGRSPFQGSSASVTYQQISQALPANILARFPPRVAALLEKLLAKRPEDRFQTPDELKLELDQQIGELKDKSPTFTEFNEVGSPEPTAEDATSFSPGQRIRNRYLILNQCRYDKTAFEAQDANTTVALRPLPLTGKFDLQQLSALREEISQIRALRHPNLAALIALESANWGLFIVSEWVNGFSLLELLQSRRHHATWSETAQLVGPLADALDFAAERQLLSRPLSLNNIYVDLPPIGNAGLSDEAYSRTQASSAGAEAKSENADTTANSHLYSLEDVQRSPVSCWPPFVLKVDTVSLGRILGSQFQSRQSIEHSAPDASAHPVRQLCCIIYQLLSGVLVTGDPANPGPLAGLTENGNVLLQRGIKEPAQFVTAKDFLLKLDAAESEPQSPPVPPTARATKQLLEVRAPKPNGIFSDARRAIPSLPLNHVLGLLCGAAFCAAIVLFAIKFLGFKIPAPANPPVVQSTRTQGASLTPSPDPTPYPGAAVGQLQLNSDPPGLPVQVVDGDRQISRGLTPMVFDAFPTGKYTVKISRPGWPDYEQQVDLQANGSINVNHAFREVNVTLKSDPPGASIFKAGVELGKTPLTVSLPLAPVELVSKIDKLLPVTQQVVPKQDGVVEFKHDYGVLSVRSNRPDADVIVGGIDTGKAPIEQDLPPGQETVVVKVSGLPEQIQRTEIQSGERVVLSFDFVAPAETPSPTPAPSPVPSLAPNDPARIRPNGPVRRSLEEGETDTGAPRETPGTHVNAGKSEQPANTDLSDRTFNRNAESAPNAAATPNTEETPPKRTEKRTHHQKESHRSLIPPGETYDQARQEASHRFDAQWDAKKRDLKVHRDFLDAEVKHSSGSTQQKWQRQLDQVKKQLSEYNSQRSSAHDALATTWDEVKRDTH